MNKVKKMQGRRDVPLNDTGREQATELHKLFAKAGVTFDKVYSSPLGRAVNTAMIVSGIQDAVIDDRLIEMDYGPYEGMDLTDPAPEVMAFFKDFANVPAPEGMEKLEEVISRLGSFLESIKDEAMTSNILISTHAIAMKGALEYLTPDSRGSYWSKYIGNCAVYTSDIVDGKFTIPVEWTE